MAAKKKKILTSLLEPAIFVEGWKNHRLRGIPRILLRMCKILLEGANEWKKMGRRSII
ncbi:hypothetical protein [Weizmannia sp. CD-2023]|uniref:hypothetical protein n=1 Tax=Weizmannia sp. CD-2023 TaxID=3037263 RepID=UPI002E248A41|nr:hypothetical protein [Weizmannia sp. CD-2023]